MVICHWLPVYKLHVQVEEQKSRQMKQDKFKTKVETLASDRHSCLCLLMYKIPVNKWFNIMLYVFNIYQTPGRENCVKLENALPRKMWWREWITAPFCTPELYVENIGIEPWVAWDSICVCFFSSWQLVLPLGFSQDMGQPAALLVRRDVLAGAGASSVEAHAADPGSVLRVCQRGEGWPRRPPTPALTPALLGIPHTLR